MVLTTLYSQLNSFTFNSHAEVKGDRLAKTRYWLSLLPVFSAGYSHLATVFDILRLLVSLAAADVTVLGFFSDPQVRVVEVCAAAGGPPLVICHDATSQRHSIWAIKPVKPEVQLKFHSDFVRKCIHTLSLSHTTGHPYSLGYTQALPHKHPSPPPQHLCPRAIRPLHTHGSSRHTSRDDP